MREKIIGLINGNNNEEAKKAIEQLKGQEKLYNSFLRNAINVTNLEMVEYLLETGIKHINFSDAGSNNVTAFDLALSKAAANGWHYIGDDIDKKFPDTAVILQLLIEKGADVTRPLSNGKIPAQMALENKFDNPKSMLKYLLIKGAKVDPELQGRYDAIKSGKIPEGSITDKDKYNYSLLDLADLYDQPNIKDQLLEKLLKQMVDSIEGNYDEAKFAAALKEYKAYARDGAISAIFEDKGGQTLLHLACGKNNLGAVKKIIEAGANPLAKDNNGKIASEISTDSRIKDYFTSFLRNEFDRLTRHPPIISTSHLEVFKRANINFNELLIPAIERGVEVGAIGFILDNINYKDKDLLSAAVDAAFKKGNIANLRKVIERAPIDNKLDSYFTEAVKIGDVHIVNVIIDNIVRRNKEDRSFSPDQYFSNAFSKAVEQGKDEIAIVILNRYFKIMKSENHTLRSMLKFSVEQNKPHLVNVILLHAQNDREKNILIPSERISHLILSSANPEIKASLQTLLTVQQEKESEKWEKNITDKLNDIKSSHTGVFTKSKREKAYDGLRNELLGLNPNGHEFQAKAKAFNEFFADRDNKTKGVDLIAVSSQKGQPKLKS